MQTLFKGLHIVDLSTVLAGPSVASFFAELGATVIKVENPAIPDVTRSWKLPSEDAASSISAYFSSVNYGKSFVQINIATEEGKKALFDILRRADILITNFKSGDEEKFGLTPALLHGQFPKLIIGSIIGFENQADRIAYDVVLQAECGFMFMNGDEQSGPVKMPVALIDVLAAHQLKEGLLCALIERERTAQGSRILCSLEKAGMASLVNQATNYLMAGYIPQRLGSLHPNIAPYGETFTCSDGKQLVIAAGSQRQFSDLCSTTGQLQLVLDERFSSNSQRVLYRRALAEILQEVFEKFPRVYWERKLIEGHVPFGSIKSMDEVLDSPTAQSMIWKEEIDGQWTQRLRSIAFTQES